MLLFLILILLLVINSAQSFLCLSYLGDAGAHWRQCDEACCSQVCHSEGYRICGKSQLGGHCNVDSDCEK